MQHKRHHRSRLPAVLIVLAGIIVGAGIMLMMADIPAPQQPVEKELDAKAFLGTPRE